MTEPETIADTLRSIRDEAAGLVEQAPDRRQREESRARISNLTRALQSAEPLSASESRLWYQRLLSEIAVLKYLLGAQAAEVPRTGGRADRDIQWAAGLVRDVSRLLLRLVSQR